MILSGELKDDIYAIIENLGFSVYDIETSNKKISIYIDKVGGVSISDCTDVSRNLSVLLDVEYNSSDSYTLEVSSPGINRKLRTDEHFKAAVGKKCLIKTHEKIGDTKTFRGILKSIDENSILLSNDKDIVIEKNNIKKARIDAI